MKHEFYLQNVMVPPQFVSKATRWVANFDGGVVVVCDGGIDHHITKKPPPNKATIFPHNHRIFINAVTILILS